MSDSWQALESKIEKKFILFCFSFISQFITHMLGPSILRRKKLLFFTTAINFSRHLDFLSLSDQTKNVKTI